MTYVYNDWKEMGGGMVIKPAREARDLWRSTVDPYKEEGKLYSVPLFFNSLNA